MYQRLPGDLSEWMGEDMDVIWDSFLNNSANPSEVREDARVMYLPAAEQLIYGLGEKMISEKYGIEYVLGAGSKVLPVDRDLFCQDVLTIPTGVRDPRKVTTAHFWTRPIMDSPLLVFPSQLGETDQRVLSGLTDAFVDTLTALNEPLRIAIYPKYGGSSLLDLVCPFTELLKLGGAGRLVEFRNLGSPSEEMGNNIPLCVYVDGKLFSQTELRYDFEEKRRYETPGLTYGHLVRRAHDILEARFLLGVGRVQKQAKEAADLMVAQLKERHGEDWNRKAETAVSTLSEIIYGTWVESLLLLWRKNFSNPAAGYLR